MFQASVDPVGGSLALSALMACLPLLTFFVILVGVKLKAHISALCALVVALLVAIFAFKMPLNLAVLSATQGAAYGAFPIVFIIVMAVWFYQITVKAGRFEDLRSFFDIVGGGDVRIQAVLIAFCFGALLEALAGFGAPIAITATMVLALGVKPLRAGVAVLVANTAPVAFGAVGTPITMAGNMVSGGDAGVAASTASHVAGIVGVQAPLFALFVPFVVFIIIDGRKAARDCWLPALVIGVSFAVAQWWCSNHFAFELTDVVASLFSLGVAVIFMRFWKPKGAAAARERLGLVSDQSTTREKLTALRAWMALLPYIIVVVVFGMGKLWLPGLLASTDLKLAWPFLAGNVLDAQGANPGTTYTFAWLSNPGTLLLIAGLIVSVVYALFNEKGRYRLSIGTALAELFLTIWRMRLSCLTIILVLALSYVMNFSGQTISIGQLLAGTGVFFSLLSPVLGWVGTAVTGSDTSANALFASLQHTAAAANPALASAPANLFLGSNTMGGVMGKMISPQSLAIAAVATGEHESTLFRRVILWSVGFLVVLCLLVFLQSNILGFMIPSAHA